MRPSASWSIIVLDAEAVPHSYVSVSNAINAASVSSAGCSSTTVSASGSSSVSSSTEGSSVSSVPVLINFAGGSVSSDDFISDEGNDLAVIRTSHSFEGLPTAQKPRIGHWVMAVGNPLGLDRSVNFGTVSNVENTQIILDVAINPGNSGGPLVNADGQVVGVTSSVVTDANNIGIALALKQLCINLLVCEDGKWQ